MCVRAYVLVCVRVCRSMCAFKREREKERDRETETERDREREIE